jgi:GntR family transcriptional regulator
MSKTNRNPLAENFVMATRNKRAALSNVIADLDIQPRADPLYRRIFLALQTRILSGDFDQGRYLPSEHELAKSFGVSRITAMRALNDLASAGLVVREQGRGTRARTMSSGTIVRGPVAETTAVDQPNPVLKKDADRDYITVLDLREVAATKEAAAALGIRTGRKIVRSVRLLKFGGRPYAHVTTYLRPNLGTNWQRHDLERGPLAKFIESEGIALSRATEVVSAIPAESQISKQLEIVARSPVLQVIRTSFDSQDDPVEYLIALHPPDRYRYAVTSNFGLGLIG